MRVLVSAIGTMNARATAVVRAKVSGELLKLHFKEGDEVKAGQLLAEIDPRSFAASLAQVQGSLARDQAQLKNAQLDLQRYKELQAQDSIARQQVDTQAALVRQLQGTVAADQGQVDAAKLQLSYTRITAPISGRLGLRPQSGWWLVGSLRSDSWPYLHVFFADEHGGEVVQFATTGSADIGIDPLLG